MTISCAESYSIDLFLITQINSVWQCLYSEDSLATNVQTLPCSSISALFQTELYVDVCNSSCEECCLW